MAKKVKAQIVQLRVVLRAENGSRHERLIDKVKLDELQAAFNEAGGDFFKLLIEQSEPAKIITNAS